MKSFSSKKKIPIIPFIISQTICWVLRISYISLLVVLGMWNTKDAGCQQVPKATSFSWEILPGTEVKSMNSSWTISNQVKESLSLTVWPWEKQLISLGSSFLIWYMGNQNSTQQIMLLWSYSEIIGCTQNIRSTIWIGTILTTLRSELQAPWVMMVHW